MGKRVIFGLFFIVLLIQSALALQTDPTEIGDILTNSSERTLVIALGPSNQRAEWRNSGEYYTLYSALPEVWKVTLSGLPAFTFSGSENVNISMWAKPDPFTEVGYELTRSSPGEVIYNHHNWTLGTFPFEMQIIDYTSDLANNLQTFANSFVMVSPADNYTYSANISMFRSTQHTVDNLLITYSPNSTSPVESSPKIRLRWRQATPTFQNIVSSNLNWSFPGNNSIYSQVHSFGSMPDDGNTWTPVMEIIGGNTNETGTIAFRSMIRIQNESGVMFWPMGRGNWGYNSTLTDSNWFNQTAITNESWKQGLSAIRAPNYTRLIIFDHIGLADIVGGSDAPENLDSGIASFHSRLRNVSEESGFTEIIIVNVIDPLIPATTSEKIQNLSREKLEAAGNDTGTAYLIDLAKVLSNSTDSSYASQPSEWLADTRHSTYLGTVEIMTMLWKELTTYYGTEGTVYWETSSRKIVNTTLDSQSALFNNTDTRERPIRLYNLTDTLIYFQNGSVVCSNVSACMGNINYTLNQGNYTYILDNFNLTEGVARESSPLFFNSSTNTEKYIASNLSTEINTTIVASVSSCDFSSFTINSVTPTYSCSDSQLVINVTQINPGNNLLSISYPSVTTTMPAQSSGNPPIWIGTFAEDKIEFSELGSVTKSLANKYRIRIKIDGEQHYVGVLEINEDNVRIEVASTPQEAKLEIGDEKSFEVNGDNTYDVKVKLNGIANNKASITVSYTEEIIGEEPTDSDNFIGGDENNILPYLMILIGVIVIISLILFYIFRSRKKPVRK